MHITHRTNIFAVALFALMLGGRALGAQAVEDSTDGVREGALFDELARMDSIQVLPR